MLACGKATLQTNAAASSGCVQFNRSLFCSRPTALVGEWVHRSPAVGVIDNHFPGPKTPHSFRRRGLSHGGHISSSSTITALPSDLGFSSCSYAKAHIQFSTACTETLHNVAIRFIEGPLRDNRIASILVGSGFRRGGVGQLIATLLAAFLRLTCGGVSGDDLLTVTSRTPLHRSMRKSIAIYVRSCTI